MNIVQERPKEQTRRQERRVTKQKSKSQRENSKTIQGTTGVDLLLSHQLSSHYPALSVILFVQTLRDSSQGALQKQTRSRKVESRQTLPDVISQKQFHNVLCSGAFDVSQIAFPYSGSIGALHDFVTWKVIYIRMRGSPLLGNCS